ncbi:diguanylate cyclase [Undibacterium sp. GrIS 1.2]|uniref:diguanylate cyclase domain-containing protein n=1 Tax=unclassified Undibacterium TaxID=2630295 RepID=UPI003393E250
MHAEKYLCVKASIGISLYPNDGQDADTLNKNPDTTMYFAKTGIRNTDEFFRSNMDTQVI